MSTTSTAHAISPDSGRPWAEPGAWPVAEGLHRIPLPLPNDGLRAVNVYALETDEGVTLVDGGWAIAEARSLLESCLAGIGYGFGDVTRFLLTHVHRDHYTLASVIAREFGAHVSLGSGERATLDQLHRPRTHPGARTRNHSPEHEHEHEHEHDDHEHDDPTVTVLRASGALGVAERWAASAADHRPDLAHWGYPDAWLQGDHPIEVGRRTLDAVHTPGHTQGHYVFADRAAGLLLAGDHVLPTITPSIGFEAVPVRQPLRDFLASLTKVRRLPDLAVLPAHGPLAPSSHARVDALLAHHEDRLLLCRDVLRAGSGTAYDVAADLPWTRHERRLADLDLFNTALASLETKAHLELLVARGQATREETPDGVRFTGVDASPE